MLTEAENLQLNKPITEDRKQLIELYLAKPEIQAILSNKTKS